MPVPLRTPWPWQLSSLGASMNIHLDIHIQPLPLFQCMDSRAGWRISSLSTSGIPSRLLKLRVRRDQGETGFGVHRVKPWSHGAQWEFVRAWEPNIRPAQCHLTINSCHNSCIFLIAKIQVFLVTGGYGSGYLDSTELYEPSVGSWVIARAKLPRPMISLKAINIDDRVLIFGSLRLFYTWSLVS